MIDQERQDLPSASKFSRLATCPGSHLLEIALKKSGKIPIESDSDAASQGRVGHEMLALWARDPSALEDEVTWSQEARAIWDKMSPLTRETYWRATEQAEELLRRYGAVDEEGRILPAFAVEQRLHAQGLYSAQIDALWFFERAPDLWIGVLIDWKTLFGSYAEAASNLQLMAQIGSMPDIMEGCCTLYAAIIQPNKGKPTVTGYGNSHIRDAAATSRSIAASALDPNAPRKAGDQCKLCPCAARCPEALETVDALDTIGLSGGLVGQSIAQVVAESDSKALGKWMEYSKLARKVADAVEAEMRRRIESGEEIRHPDGRVWSIGKGKTEREVEDPNRLWSQAVALVPGLSADDMMECVTIAKGKFEAMLRPKAGLVGRKQSKDWKTLRDTVYTGVLGEKQQRGSLVLGDAVEEIEQTEDEQ